MWIQLYNPPLTPKLATLLMATSTILFTSSTPFIDLPTKLYRLPLHGLEIQIHEIIFKTPKYYLKKTKIRKSILKLTLWKTTNMSKTTCCFRATRATILFLAFPIDIEWPVLLLDFICIVLYPFRGLQWIATSTKKKLDVDFLNCQYARISSTNRTLILIQLRTLKKEQNVIVKN